MIVKIKSIGKLAVFQDFEWDKTLGTACQFKDINVLYGRNYSGKTTLSRILRAMETGVLSDKFESPRFCVTFKDGTEVDQSDILMLKKKVRVFNEDFVRDNLRFINNPDESIEPFAILGDDNNKIEKEIEALESEIGSQEEGTETGLFAQLKIATQNFDSVKNEYDNAQRNLDKQLSDKATDRHTGIKYKPERFGDQNYNKPKLEGDIKIVLKEGFQPITNEQQTKKGFFLISSG